MMRLEYVGLKDSETDHLYGTNLTWLGKGSTHDVPDEAGAKMLRHPDVWQLAAEQPAAPAPTPAPTPAPAVDPEKQLTPKEQSAIEEHKALEVEDMDPGLHQVNLQTMDKLALRQYAMRAFGKEFSPETTRNQLLSEVRSLQVQQGIQRG